MDLDHDIAIFWIGARTTVNPFAVEEIAEALAGTTKIILVKNPVSSDLSLWIGALERLANKGVEKIGCIHRGFSSYSKTKYRNAPQWNIPMDMMRKFSNLPMICDPSHICGNREGIKFISQNAFYLNFDGLMIESHIDPENALSDAKQQITPSVLKEMIENILLPKDVNSSQYEEKLSYKRDEIDEVDKKIFELLYERMSIVRAIGELKAQEQKTITDTFRHQDILNKAENIAKEFGLNVKYLQKIINIIHEHSVEVQAEIRKKKLDL